MELIRSARPLTHNPKVAVWHCPGCEVVHLSLGKKVLDLTGEELADLTARRRGQLSSTFSTAAHGMQVPNDQLSSSY